MVTREQAAALAEDHLTMRRAIPEIHQVCVPRLLDQGQQGPRSAVHAMTRRWAWPVAPEFPVWSLPMITTVQERSAAVSSPGPRARLVRVRRTMNRMIQLAMPR